jgi:uncharacterized membrane protein
MKSKVEISRFLKVLSKESFAGLVIVLRFLWQNILCGSTAVLSLKKFVLKLQRPSSGIVALQQRIHTYDDVEPVLTSIFINALDF